MDLLKSGNGAIIIVYDTSAQAGRKVRSARSKSTLTWSFQWVKSALQIKERSSCQRFRPKFSFVPVAARSGAIQAGHYSVALHVLEPAGWLTGPLRQEPSVSSARLVWQAARCCPNLFRGSLHGL